MEGSLLEQAKLLLRNRGVVPSFLSHREARKGDKVHHLFRGGYKGRSIRFLGKLAEDGSLVDLIAITSAERKYIGKTGKDNLGERKQSMGQNRGQKPRRPYKGSRKPPKKVDPNNETTQPVPCVEACDSPLRSIRYVTIRRKAGKPDEGGRA